MYLHIFASMKTNRIVFYVVTGLFSAMVLFSAGMYFFNTPEVANEFAKLGYPLYIIYPLGIAKILGVIAIWTNLSKVLKYLAYAGFFYNTLLAMGAHLNIGDGEFIAAAIVMALVIVSFVFDQRIQAGKAA